MAGEGSAAVSPEPQVVEETFNSEKYGSEVKGEPFKYDPTFNGPIKNRSCTDVICCIVFAIFMVAFFIVGIWAFAMGDPRVLLYPSDSDGNICGYGEFENKPYVFFFDLLDCAKTGPAIIALGCPTPQICIDECPQSYWSWVDLSAREHFLKDKDADGRSRMICKDVDPVASNKICVASCPATDFTWLYAKADEGYARSHLICKHNVNPLDTSKSVEALVEDEDCAPYYMKSSPMVGRCVPTYIKALVDEASGVLEANGTEIVDKLGNAVNGTELETGVGYLAYFLNIKEYGMKIFQDVRASWWLIVTFLVVAAVVTFLWIILLRWVAAPIVWLTLICFVGIFAFGTYYCFTKWVKMKDNPDHDGAFIFTTNLDYYTNLSNTWLAFGIIAAIFLGVFLLLILFLRERILIAIALIKETSRAIGSMIFTLFWPLIPFVLQIVFLTYWGASALFLASVGGKQFGESNITYVNTTDDNGVVHVQKQISQVITDIPCDPNMNGTAGDVCSFIKYGGEYTVYLQIFQLFMWFWIMNFIVALGEMTLAGAFASYYWAFKKPQDIPTFPVSASLWRALRYHMGTLAFGAFIIAIIQMIRVMLEYIDAKLKGAENQVAKFFMKCMKCCFWCLEKFMKFINKNAYIMTAVYGKNFCTAAKDAFMLIMRNIVRVAVVDKVTDFLMLVGTLMITAGVTILSFFFFSGDLSSSIPWANISDYVASYVPHLNYYLIPSIIIGISAFIIASGFFSVYSMGVDTLFLSFLEDLERNDGSPEKPYYMSQELMGILGKKNRKPGEKEKKSGCCGCC